MTARLMPFMLLVLASCSPARNRQPHPAPSPSAAPAGSIPAEFQGRYGLTVAACNAGPGATPVQVRGLLTIGGDAIAFGVSPQSVDSIAIRADRIVFDTSETVEGGAVESRRYAFRPSADRTTLTRVETNRPDLVYTRCPNRPS